MNLESRGGELRKLQDFKPVWSPQIEDWRKMKDISERFQIPFNEELYQYRFPELLV
jgi:hypothetical protein